MKFALQLNNWLLASALTSTTVPTAAAVASSPSSNRLRGGGGSKGEDRSVGAVASPSHPKDTNSASHRRDRRDLASPKSDECVLQVVSLLKIDPEDDSFDELQFECEMDPLDAGGVPNQTRRVSGTPDQARKLEEMFRDGDIIPGQSTLSLGGGSSTSDSWVGVGKSDLVLGRGFDIKSRVKKNGATPGNGAGRGPGGGGGNGAFGRDQRGRRLASNPITGDKPTLVVKVRDVNGLARDESPAQIGDDVFGTLGDSNNLKSQMEACSMNKLTIVPGDNGSGFVDQELYEAPGVVEVTIPIDMTTQFNDVRNSVTSEVQSLLGLTLPGPYQQVLYVLEGCYGSGCGWAAYAYIDSWNSVYQGGYYKATGVLMHELGHNFNLAHSGGLDGATYSDHTCMMGNPLYGDDNGQMCFNAAKNWQLTWYDDRELLLTPLAETSDWTQTVVMIGVADYLNNPSAHPVTIKLETNTGQDYFIGFNRATGVNSNNDQADDLVTIYQVESRDGTGYSQSWLRATLGQGQGHVLSLGGKSVFVDVDNIDLTSSPGTATITFRAEEVPTLSPTPKPPQCAGSDTLTCGCANVLQDDYRGTMAVTASGKTCQAWTSQSPHSHSRTPENYPDKGLEGGHNYCRNPDGESGAWCYTTDPGTRWELCDVPDCVGEPTFDPTPSPTKQPTTPSPTNTPTENPTPSPTPSPTSLPTNLPTSQPTACAGADPLTCGCDAVLQADYRGEVSTTSSGLICQAWTSQSPHSHSRTPGNYPDKGLEGGHNYCRNPDGEPGGAWCYTSDPNVRWAYCDIQSCVPPTDPTSDPTPSPTNTPTKDPTNVPTEVPTPQPTPNPTTAPPTDNPTPAPSNSPTNDPTSQPSPSPTTAPPTNSPSPNPTSQPTSNPTIAPSSSPTNDVTAPLPVCATPELSSLESLTSDRRTTYQNAGLPTITGGISTTHEASCQTDINRKKVLMIGIDGLRSDVIGMTPLPSIRRLQAMGTYSFWANVQSSASAVSGPGWASMFTGVESTKHLVNGNGDLGDRASPTVFKLVKDSFNLKIAASVSWSPLVTELIEPSSLDASFLASSDEAMSAKAVDWISSEAYDFVFVDFDGPDAAGHGNGFDGYASPYQNKVLETDALIGNLLDAMVSTSSGEEWLIVLTSDHGGEGTSHGPEDAYNRKIPFMVASNSPRVNVGFMPMTDPGSQMDVLPTIMHFLGGPSAVPPELDGQVFGFSDYTRAPPPTPGVCIPDPETCGCESSKQADYRGTIAVTASGKTCQAWTSQSPHSHSRTPENYPSSGLEGGHNYCRNPDGESGAWCYTTDPGTRWELCDIPDCDTT